MKYHLISRVGRDQSGAIAITTAVMLTMLLGFTALAIDIGHLVLTKNELQNSADAGALASAKVLYNSTGTAIQDSVVYDSDGITIIGNQGANEIAYKVATANKSDGSPAEVNWSGGNTGDVLRGHWSFTTKTFTPNASTTVLDLENRTAADLDTDTDFINAVQVTARRQSTPIISFFAGIFGYSGFQQSATSVAWVGFAGRFFPGEFDLPIAICEELLGQPFKCGVAVMYEQDETAMWTNMSQPETSQDSCNSADSNEVKALIGTGNLTELNLGVDMGVNNGVIDIAVSKLIERWINENGTDKFWRVRLPVVSCIDNDTGAKENSCAELTGGVVVEIIWMTDKENIQAYKEVPFVYYNIDQDGNKTDPVFEYPKTGMETNDDNIARWNAFATAMGLVDSDGNPLPLKKDNFYFKASCEPMETSGGPGGENFGILAKYPVLVD